MADEPSHVQQAQNELASAEESGDLERVKAARKRLAAAGVEVKAKRSAPPQDRRSKQETQKHTKNGD